MTKIRLFWHIIRDSIVVFYETNLLNYSASIAFFTIFSLPGVLIVAILMGEFFFSKKQIRQELYQQIGSVVGPKSAVEIQEVVQSLATLDHTVFATVIGVGTILFGATSVFISMQDGLNIAWGLKPKPRIFALKFLLNRLLSFAIVLSIGFLMLVSLVVDTALLLFEDILASILSEKSVGVIEAIHMVMSTLLIWVIFLLIYKFLPNGKIRMKYLVPGSIIATALFVFGKYLIGLYLGNSALGTAYGAAGSLVVLLIWVFYSSLILLYVAELIRIYAKAFGGAVLPGPDAVRVITQEVDVG